MLRLSRAGVYLRAQGLARSLPEKPLSTLLPATKRLTARMACGGGDEQRFRDPASNPRVVQLREIMKSDAKDGWNKSWEEGVTPWDLGQTTPVILQLVQSGSLPKGRILVPGCGSGYDVVAMASAERFVVGLEIASSAIKKAKERCSSLPNANQFTFVEADFFTWQPKEKFDLIFDYTFFCAIDPSLRSAWAERIRELLKPDGELITLIYLISDQKEGPPYNNTVDDYEKVLNPVGFSCVAIEDNEIAVERRKGSEKIGRWKQHVTKSFL
ncbi:probable thiol methyltransferase 2 [Zingiber officinale]|uniref:Thiol methyltransferase 2 n=1 Tax=Zingiber officinale TaxID=94328 RepID=A0A8J5BUB6_ZINOF|nr:probable thiol methyltransferase 2 [Zingiber officinale]KAG6466330.1 hypothetical protein ZIOFF_075820 [Zingiber officinale]